MSTSVIKAIDDGEPRVQDKLQALVVHWASQGNSWKALVEALNMCEEKVIASKLAKEIGVVYPGLYICVCMFVSPVSCKDHYKSKH